MKPALIAPLKVKDIIVEPHSTVIQTSFESDSETEEDDIVYPEGVLDRRPYKTVTRFRKANGKSTSFCIEPLLVGADSVDTLVLGLECFAEQHVCTLSFAGEDQQRAACGAVDSGSIQLLATDSSLTAYFQFEIDLYYDNELAQSKSNNFDYSFRKDPK